MKTSDHDCIVSGDIKLNLPEEIRVRVARKMGLPLVWDEAVDALPNPKGLSLSAILIRLCRGYRKVRPLNIGNRCCYEPSCSRYAEIVLRIYSLPIALPLIFRRLRICNAQHGGVHLPPELRELSADKLGDYL